MNEKVLCINLIVDQNYQRLKPTRHTFSIVIKTRQTIVVQPYLSYRTQGTYHTSGQLGFMKQMWEYLVHILQFWGWCLSGVQVGTAPVMKIARLSPAVLAIGDKYKDLALDRKQLFSKLWKTSLNKYLLILILIPAIFLSFIIHGPQQCSVLPKHKHYNHKHTLKGTRR